VKLPAWPLHIPRPEFPESLPGPERIYLEPSPTREPNRNLRDVSLEFSRDWGDVTNPVGNIDSDVVAGIACARFA